VLAIHFADSSHRLFPPEDLMATPAITFRSLVFDADQFLKTITGYIWIFRASTTFPPASPERWEKFPLAHCAGA